MDKKQELGNRDEREKARSLTPAEQKRLEKFEARTLILGGNIARSLPLFLQPMQRRYGQSGMDVSVKASVLLDKSAMMGAASLFL